MRKWIGWCLLFVAAGGFLIFVVLVAALGSLPPTQWFIWPILSAIAILIAVRVLLGAYSAQPYQGAGGWHLEILDLLATSFLCALTFATVHALNSRLILSAGIPTALFVGLAFLGGILIAARKGMELRTLRWIFAAGFVMVVYGLLTLGGLATLTVVSATVYGEFFIAFEILFEPGPEDWVQWLLRGGLLALLPGWGICAIASASIPRAIPVPPAPTESP